MNASVIKPNVAGRDVIVGCVVDVGRDVGTIVDMIPPQMIVLRILVLGGVWVVV